MAAASGPEHDVPATAPVGKAALIASVGGQRNFADWTNADHRSRRLLAELIGVARLTFVLSGRRPLALGPFSAPRCVMVAA